MLHLPDSLESLSLRFLAILIYVKSTVTLIMNNTLTRLDKIKVSMRTEAVLSPISAVRQKLYLSPFVLNLTALYHQPNGNTCYYMIIIML